MPEGLIIGSILLGSVVTGIFSASMAQHFMLKDIKILCPLTFWTTLANMVLWMAIWTFSEESLLVILNLLVASALLSLSVVDGFTYEIPPQINLFIVGIGVLRLFFDRNRWYEYLIGAVCVSGLFLLIALATKGKGMGGGDIKLMAALGFFLGWKKIVLVMVFGCILGAIIHSVIMAVSKKERMLAFGPYLSAAGIIIMIWGDRLIELYVKWVLPSSMQ